MNDSSQPMEFCHAYDSHQGRTARLARSGSPRYRFHARGGANPVLVLPAFKRTQQPGMSTHGSDIVVMRYERDDEGAWPVAMPAMHFKRVGPLQARLASTARSLRTIPQTSRRLLPKGRVVAPEAASA